MHLGDLQQKKHIAILGYGLEGQSTYRFLRQHGIPAERITILDKKVSLDLPEGVQHHCGENYLDSLEQFDCIRRAPGITKTIIEQVRGKTIKGLPFISQTEFFLDNYQGIIVGITGTKGKSTISTLTALTLQHAGLDVLLAGNVGKPVLELIDRDNPPALVVYELSSFMIESVLSDRTGRTIDIAIFNTLYNTHTKEHGGYENYARAKLLLLEHSKQALVGYQAKSVIEEQFPDIAFPPHTRIYGKEGYYQRDGKHFCIQHTPIADDTGMLLLGEHNRENACAVLGICDLLHIEIAHFQAVLQQFSGLEHRLEYVGNYKDILRYNDAIATTPEATCAALDSFGSKIDTLFYGGITGEYKHHLVAKKIQDYDIKQIILFPDTGEELYALLDEETKASVTIFRSRSMEEAVQRAAQHTAPGSIALLSCGSPSFSLWSGFVEKGNRFKDAVRAL